MSLTKVKGSMQLLSVVSKTSTYTATLSDDVILCSGTWTLSLYAASGNAGKVLWIKNTGTGSITIDPNASETLDGAGTKVLSAKDAFTLICDGSNWWIF